MKLTKTQQATLNTIAAKGGRTNSWAGQQGINLHSLDALLKRGLVERVSACDGCLNEGECQIPGERRCYGPRQITEAGWGHVTEPR